MVKHSLESPAARHECDVLKWKGSDRHRNHCNIERYNPHPEPSQILFSHSLETHDNRCCDPCEAENLQRRYIERGTRDPGKSECGKAEQEQRTDDRQMPGANERQNACPCQKNGDPAHHAYAGGQLRQFRVQVLDQYDQRKCLERLANTSSDPHKCRAQNRQRCVRMRHAGADRQYYDQTVPSTKTGGLVRTSSQERRHHANRCLWTSNHRLGERDVSSHC